MEFETELDGDTEGLIEEEGLSDELGVTPNGAKAAITSADLDAAPSVHSIVSLPLFV